MINRYLTFLSILILLVSAVFDCFGDSKSDAFPWFQAFTPLRTFYVSPSKDGDGKSPDTAMSFKKALTNGSPGDLFWVMEGRYTGTFSATRAGTEKDPIVFRAEKGRQVIIEGGVRLEAPYNWIWGFEITDPKGIKPVGGGVELLAPGNRAINNVIHDHLGKIGIGAWQQGKGHVIYGNIIYHQLPKSNNPHNLYAQNDFESWGYKYFVNNILADSEEATDKTFNVHCYTQGGLLTGLWFEKNIIQNGKFLIGGFNAPAENDVVKENYFYKSNIQFGFRRPTQVQFQNNYVARTPLVTEWFWGAGETQFKQTTPSVYTGNEFVNPPGPHIRFSTSAYLPSGRCEGCSRIRPDDIFDKNKYSAPFQATFYADSRNAGIVDLETWRRITAQAGKGFDANSEQVEAPKGVKTVILKNEYDPLRAHVAVYNWSEEPRVRLDLGAYLPVGTKFAIHDAKQIFQAPVLAGTYSGPIEIPVDGEFRVLVVIRQ